MRFTFSERRAYLNILSSHGVWEVWIGGIWLVISIWSFVKTETFTPELQDKWQLVHMIPALSFEAWAAVSALLLALWIFEASFRDRKKTDGEILEIKNNIRALREVIRPKLKSYFSNENPGCIRKDVTLSSFHPITGQVLAQRKCTYYRLEIKADCIGSVPQCAARLLWIKKDSVTVFSGEQLVLTFVPAEKPDCEVKDVLDKIPALLDVIVISHDNEINIATKNFVYPSSINIPEIFKEPGDYLLHIVIASPNSVAIEHDLTLKWTGDWRTAQMN